MKPLCGHGGTYGRAKVAMSLRHGHMDLLEPEVVPSVPLLSADISRCKLYHNSHHVCPVVVHRVYITLVRLRHKTLVMFGYVLENITPVWFYKKITNAWISLGTKKMLTLGKPQERLVMVIHNIYLERTRK